MQEDQLLKNMLQMKRLKEDAIYEPQKLDELKDQYDQIANQKEPAIDYSQNEHQDYKANKKEF